MKQFYKLSDGKIAEIEVNPAVAKLLTAFQREDESAARKRRRRKEVSIEAMNEETGWEPTDTSVNIETDFIVNEEKETLLAAIARLSDTQRQLIQFRYYEKKTVTEIAVILGIHHSNVIRQLETIHNALKKYLENLL